MVVDTHSYAPIFIKLPPFLSPLMYRIYGHSLQYEVVVYDPQSAELSRHIPERDAVSY